MKRNVMPADELASLVFLGPNDSPNGRERWRLVVTPDGVQSDAYLVSTEGRILRVKGGRGATPGTLLRMSPTRDGYPTACLSVDCIRHTWNVHTIVAWTFHGAAPEDEFGKFEAHHIDEDRANNVATNLQWVSAKDNASSDWHKRMTGR